jgi:hypothetical protein
MSDCDWQRLGNASTIFGFPAVVRAKRSLVCAAPRSISASHRFIARCAFPLLIEKSFRYVRLPMSPTEYLNLIDSIFRTGRASEHSYRIAFATFVESRAKEEITALNDPKREECGAPDYAVSLKQGGAMIAQL